RGDAAAAANARHADLAVAGAQDIVEGDQQAAAAEAGGMAEGNGATQTVTLARSHPSSRSLASIWAAKASFTSMKSISARVIPAFFRARGMEWAGPSPMVWGATAVSAKDTTEKSGMAPRALAWARVVSTMAQAASPMVQALTVPAFLKAGLSLERLSRVDAGRRGSSRSNSWPSGFLRVGTKVKGTISRAKWPAAWALPAFCWDSRAKASCSSRLMPYFSAWFSAVCPMP